MCHSFIITNPIFESPMFYAFRQSNAWKISFLLVKYNLSKFSIYIVPFFLFSSLILSCLLFLVIGIYEKLGLIGAVWICDKKKIPYGVLQIATSSSVCRQLPFFKPSPESKVVFVQQIWNSPLNILCYLIYVIFLIDVLSECVTIIRNVDI